MFHRGRCPSLWTPPPNQASVTGSYVSFRGLEIVELETVLEVSSQRWTHKQDALVQVESSAVSRQRSSWHGLLNSSNQTYV
jgi:hypothetical protein